MLNRMQVFCCRGIGGSLGAVLAFVSRIKKKRNVDNSRLMNGSLLGPKYKNDQIEKVIFELQE